MLSEIYHKKDITSIESGSVSKQNENVRFTHLLNTKNSHSLLPSINYYYPLGMDGAQCNSR